MPAAATVPAPPLVTPAPAPAKPPVPKERRPLSLANHALGRSEVAFLAMLVIGEVVAFAQHFFGHVPRSLLTTARIGGLYVFGSLHVPIQVRASASGQAGTFLELSIAFLTITAIGVVLLFRGGESVGGRAAGGLVRRGLWGAAVGVPFAVFTLLLALLVRFEFPLNVIEGGKFAVGVSKPWAVVLPLVLGVVAGAMGGVWSGLSRAKVTPASGAAPPRSGALLAAGAFAGAWRMFVAALALSFVALLVLAGLKPDATRAYLDGTALSGHSGIDLLGHHLLALPNQSLFVLVPAMGGCDHVEGTAEPREFLCLSKIPKHGDLNLTAPFFPGNRRLLRSPFEGVRFGDPPSGFWLFLLVPVGAALIGGIRASRPARSRGRAAAAGALAGVGFAVLVAIGCVAAGLTIKFFGGRAPATLTMQPDPVAGALLGLAWGVAGGTVGAFLGWRRPVKKAPPAQPTATTQQPQATQTEQTQTTQPTPPAS